MKLLIQNANILAAGDLVETDDSVFAEDAIYPKHVIEGWNIVECDVPHGFTPAGYTWDGAQVVAKPPEVIPPTVPQQVTMRQARLALLAVGKLNDIDTAIASLPSPQKEAAQIEWEFSSVVERNRPLLIALAAGLSMTSEQIDQLFITASSL